MANATHGLRPLNYEAETGLYERLNRDQRPILDNEQVARLLLGAPSWPRSTGEREPDTVIERADEDDALVAMRGLMLGLAWVAPMWVLFAAAIILV
jgi:hypothetical protein